MLTNYFKARNPFEFDPHPFEPENILGLKKGYEDNLFLLKIYDMEESSFQDYYNYHLRDPSQCISPQKRFLFTPRAYCFRQDRLFYGTGSIVFKACVPYLKY